MRLIFCFFAFSTLSASFQEELTYDLDMSPYAGGSSLLFVSRLPEMGLTKLESTLFKEDSRSSLARWYRFTELSLAYLPLNIFTSVVQHEVFGHGYRIRTIDGADVIGYEFDAPPPYGDGGGLTKYTFNPFKISPSELISISAAGLEAQNILATLEGMKWIDREIVNPRNSALYLFNRFSINLYASEDDFSFVGDDLGNYVEDLNNLYNGDLKPSKIKNMNLFTLLDPLSYFSVGSWCYYLSTGKDLKLPMIPIGNAKYLFGSHTNLSPFGPEVFFDNYLKLKGRSLYFYLKGGHFSENTFVGFGFYSESLWNRSNFHLGVRIDGWMQPKLTPPYSQEHDFFDPPNKNQTNVGASGSLIGSYQPKPLLGIKVELGGKTQGYLPGYSLNAFPTFRISYLATF